MINRIYNPLARILYTDLDLKNLDAGGTQEPAPTPPEPPISPEDIIASVTTISNTEYTKVIVDADDKILYGLRTDGTEYTPDLTGDTITIDNITYDAQFIVDIVKATL